MSLPVRFWREYPQNQDNHYPKIGVSWWRFNQAVSVGHALFCGVGLAGRLPNFGVITSFVYGYVWFEMRMLACENT
jgi:hypothetical protein